MVISAVAEDTDTHFPAVQCEYAVTLGVKLAGLDAPANDSGQIVDNHRSMSKIGSAALRRTLFLIMSVYLQQAPDNEPIYRFMDKNGLKESRTEST